MVGRRFARAEVQPQGQMDLAEMRILVRVGTEWCENHHHRKGKGSLTMQFSQGLVDPNQAHNLCREKGKQVNIPVLLVYKWQHKFSTRLFGLSQHCINANQDTPKENHNDENLGKLGNGSLYGLFG